MQVRLLGPVDVAVDGTPRPVPGLRRRAVLAVLALRRGQVVSTDRLVDVVWGGAAPPTATNTLQSHVSHLRRVLGPTAAIRARPPGYLLDLADGGTDVEVAERLIRQGTRSPDSGQRARQLQDALALWRGRSLVDVAGLSWLDEQGERLDHLWSQAKRALVEARLALGEHEQLVPELRQMTREHPLDEQVAGQLMLALYRAGRQADALAVYDRLRRTLNEDLGIDPGQPLRDLEVAILRQDPALDPRPPAIEVAAAAPVPVPAQLPLTVRAFTGRAAELAALDAALATAGTGTGPEAVAISAVCGTAGVGKTALAVHWAHRVADRFPDGQLYVNLRGFDPTGSALDPAEAVRGFLDALGVPVTRIPAGLDAQAALYRSLLAGRRVLVVLDNARDAEQVRPLLPGSAGCHVVVTSRDELSGLVARDGARRVRLGVLPHAEALDLLRALIGERDDEPEAAAALACRCARLPLALRIAADLVTSRPGTSLAELVAELACEQRRLDLLDAGADSGTAVRAVFSWSERHLPPAATRLFWLLGLHPGPDVDDTAAGALAGTDPAEAGGLTETLARAHLVERVGPGRWAMHDLLRAFARERAARHVAEPDRLAALGRLYDCYLVRAAAAMDVVFPGTRHWWQSQPPGGRRVAPPFTDLAAARHWLDTERLNLVALVAAANAELDGYAVQIARTLGQYLTVGYHNADAFAVHHRALAVSEGTGDRAGQAQALLELASAYARSGRPHDSLDHVRRALDLFRHLADHAGVAKGLQQLGNLETQLGRYHAALLHYRESLGLHRETGDRAGEAGALASVGQVLWTQGQHQEATAHLERAGAIYDEIGHRVGHGRVLNDLGNILQCQRRYAEAHGCHQRALRILREVGDRAAEACALTDLGRVYSRWGRHEQALDHHGRALAAFREIEDSIGEVEVLIDLGAAHEAMARHDEAADHHRRAHALAVELGHRRLQCRALCGQGRALRARGLAAQALVLHRAAHSLAADIGDREQQARALDGMAAAYEAVADPGLARQAWSDALEIFAELGLPEAAEVRTRLTALPAAP